MLINMQSGDSSAAQATSEPIPVYCFVVAEIEDQATSMPNGFQRQLSVPSQLLAICNLKASS